MSYVREFSVKAERPLSKAGTEKILESIWREYERRLSSKFANGLRFGLSRNENAKNFLRREIYALGMALNRKKPKWEISELLTHRSNKSTRHKAVEGHVFHVLLMVLYDDDSQISRQERWTMARELEYAFRHRVPSRYLTGFLFQSGGRKDLVAKLKEEYVEPGFEDQAVL